MMPVYIPLATGPIAGVIAWLAMSYMDRRRDGHYIKHSANIYSERFTFLKPERGDLIEIDATMGLSMFSLYSDKLAMYVYRKPPTSPVTFEVIDIDGYCVSMREVGRKKVIQCALNSEYASINRFMSAANKAWRLEKLTYAALT